MTEGALLLAGIIAEPGDDTARLVYADWLQEQGDEARAELIRVQIELARREAEEPQDKDGAYLAGFRSAAHREESTLAAFFGSGCRCAGCLTRRAKDLLAGPPPEVGTLRLSNAALWFAGDVIGMLTFHPEFIRGFVERVECIADDWFARGDRLRERHPVRVVRLATAPAIEEKTVVLPDGRVLYRVAGVDVPAAPGLPTGEVLALRWRGVRFEVPGEVAFNLCETRGRFVTAEIRKLHRMQGCLNAVRFRGHARGRLQLAGVCADRRLQGWKIELQFRYPPHPGEWGIGLYGAADFNAIFPARSSGRKGAA